jgi:NADH-quinone oxidoreductase subunit N
VIVIGSMISLGYYLPVIATIWMRTAPAGADGAAVTRAPGEDPVGGGEVLPALAGGSPELDREALAARRSPRSPQPEVMLVALVAGVATIVFGIVPQPLFDLVHHAGSALGGLF